MTSKADITKQYIIEKVAPIFNQKGYASTSLKDITNSTGLTKGAVYGNFTDKNELALEAFNYVLRKHFFPLADNINAVSTAKDKLNEIFKYYRTYYKETIELGGCPILNVGIDSNHLNPELKTRVLGIIDKLISNIADIVILGQKDKSFNKDVDSKAFAKRFYSLIQGSIFTAMMQKDPLHIKEMMDFLEDQAKRDLYV